MEKKKVSKIIGTIPVEDIRELLRGKGRTSDIYLVENEKGDFALETNIKVQDQKEMKIISKKFYMY